MEEKAMERIISRNREIFIRELLGEETGEERTDVCWFCGHLFRESEAVYCDECLTFKCPGPSCGRCFCNLPPETQQALEREMVSLGLWHLNPPRRKRKVLRWARVVFLRDHGGFRKGETAVLADRTASALEDRGIVKIVEVIYKE